MIIIMGMEIVLTYPQYPGNPKSYLVFAVIHKKSIMLISLLYAALSMLSNLQQRFSMLF